MNGIYLHKNIMIMELLTENRDYRYYDKESADYMISILNIVVSENIGLFFVDEEAISRYKKIIDDVVYKISPENLNNCSLLIRRLIYIKNDKVLCELHKNSFIERQCKLRNVSIKKEDFCSFIKKAVCMDNDLIPFIIYKKNCTNRNNKEFIKQTYLIESTLNYFYNTNIEDAEYYQGFINYYYKVFNIDLLGKAKGIVVDFPIKKKKIFEKILDIKI